MVTSKMKHAMSVNLYGLASSLEVVVAGSPFHGSSLLYFHTNSFTCPLVVPALRMQSTF